MENGITDQQLKTSTTGTGLDLVLLHGWGTNSHAFHAFIPHLSDEHRVTTLDLPGFGLNHNVLPEHYTLDEVCHLLASVLPERALLAGWSLGGLVAQRFALLYPQRVIGLIAIASTPHFMTERGWPGLNPEVLAMFTEQLQQNYTRTVERFLAIQAMGSVTAKQDVKGLKKLMASLPEPSHTALESGLSLLKDVDLRSQIGRITCPTLRIYGKRDTLVPVSAVDHVHALQPQADSVVLSEASHAPFISQPECCAEIIKRFTAPMRLSETKNAESQCA